jgi:hypothetical protein
MIPIIGDLISNTVGNIVNGGIEIIKKMVVDKDKQAEAEFALRTIGLQAEQELRKQEHDEKMGQIDINKIEAASEDAFVRRARPSVMWICAFALAYNFIGYPIAQWLCAIWRPEIHPPVLPDPEYLFIVLGALLGFGGFRTFEKMKGVNGK